MMSGTVSPAAERNREPILQVLRNEFRHFNTVLEIGSGTGQHAVYFAAKMSWLNWQTSDLRDNHAGINAWIDASEGSNIGRPFELDVRQSGPPKTRYDAVFSANTAHIMSIDTVNGMFAVVGRVLGPGGLFCLYGPFNMGGNFSSDSNRHFDESLRSQDAVMGIRDLEQLDKFAESANLLRIRFYSMPANNNIAVWQKYQPAEKGEKYAHSHP